MTPLSQVGRTPADRLPLDGPGDLNRLLRSRTFPFAEDGWFVFLHHDPERRLESVRLLHGLRGYREPPVFEERVPGVHVLALRAEGITRMEYVLALTGRNGKVRSIPDPLNPRRAHGPFGSASVAYGAGYAAPIHARPPAADARGHLSLVRAPVALDHRGRRRVSDAWIWDPPGFERAAPLPVLLVLDGTEYLRFAGLRETIENLLADGAIAPCRAVFLPPTDRNREYSADPRMPGLLRDDLLTTLVDAAALPSGVPVIGIGASLGGLAMLHAHASDPGLFSGLLLQSGSFFTPATDPHETGFAHYERITSFVASILDGTQTVAPIPMHLTCGLGGENLENNRAMLAALRDAGVPAELDLVADAHNWIAWRDCIGPGLTALLSP